MAITINGTTGITTTGDYDAEDGDKILLGTGDDLQIHHTSNKNYINAQNYNLAIQRGGTTSLEFDGNGDLNLPDSKVLGIGTGADLQIYHDGSHSFIKDTGTGNLKICSDLFRVNNAANDEAMIKAEENAGVTLSYNGNTRLETDANGIHVTTNVHLPDNGALEFGDGSDTTITHSGSDFTLTNNTGGLTIGNNSGTGTGEGHIIFKAGSNTECAKFTKSGFLKAKGNSASYHSETAGYHEIVGDTAHDCTLKIKHNSSAGYGVQTLFNHASSSRYALSVRDYSDGNTDKAFIRCDGDFESSNNSYGGISDVKLKENIVDAESQWNDIKALKVRNFNFKIDENKTKLLGLVAQEAEAVCPSLVKSQPDLGADNEDLGTKTKVLKYSILYMKAVKALQEAIAKIETLETKVAALEAA